MGTGELASLREELATVKTERMSLQARVAELKAVLEANVRQAKVGTAWGS